MPLRGNQWERTDSCRKARHQANRRPSETFFLGSELGSYVITPEHVVSSLSVNRQIVLFWSVLSLFHLQVHGATFKRLLFFVRTDPVRAQ